MLYIFVGCMSFLMFILYDLNEVRLHKSWFRPLYIIGCSLMVFSTVMLALNSASASESSTIVRVVFAGLSLISLLLLIYSLFFALPFKKTYITFSNRNVYDRGVYALCRHPGVLCFICFYLFFWLYSGESLILLAFLCFSVLNIFYSWLQDHYFFPELFDGYDLYKKRTPFLLPTFISIKSCLDSIKTR